MGNAGRAASPSPTRCSSQSEGLPPPPPLPPSERFHRAGGLRCVRSASKAGWGWTGWEGREPEGGWGGEEVGGGGKESEGGGRGGGVLLLSEKKGKNIY